MEHARRDGRGRLSRPGRNERFEGAIAGVGSQSGTRVVIGRWARSPLGFFADAMVERADGHRVLVAPTQEVADFVAATYVFDEVRLEPIAVTGSERWEVRSPSLSLDLALGSRMPLGWLLRSVPSVVATQPWFTRVTDPVARVVMGGVRTRGVAKAGRQEFYAATDLRRVVSIEGEFEGVILGELTEVWPACRFGFSSTPRTPSVTSVTTTVTPTKH